MTTACTATNGTPIACKISTSQSVKPLPSSSRRNICNTPQAARATCYSYHSHVTVLVIVTHFRKRWDYPTKKAARRSIIERTVPEIYKLLYSAAHCETFPFFDDELDRHWGVPVIIGLRFQISAARGESSKISDTRRNCMCVTDNGRGRLSVQKRGNNAKIIRQ